MDYLSKINVAQTEHLIGQARDELAQFRGSLFHTQQLIDASIQQTWEIQELLTRVGIRSDELIEGVSPVQMMKINIWRGRSS